MTNPLCSRRIVLVFYKWFAYLPLWTSLLTKFEERYAKIHPPVDMRVYEQGRLTNAQVESYFDILKDSILERKTNLRPTEVILSLYRSIECQLKADKYGVAQNLKNRKGKLKDMNVVESWRKTKRRRNTYLKRIDRSSPKQDSSNVGSPRLKPIVANKTVSDYSDLNHTISHVLNDLSNVTEANKVQDPSSIKFVQFFCKSCFQRISFLLGTSSHNLYKITPRLLVKYHQIRSQMDHLTRY